MRLLRYHGGQISLTEHLPDDIPQYAILSHRWGLPEDEVTFDDMKNGTAKAKRGYQKLQFCAKQSLEDKLEYFWIDTCCINKSDNTELQYAINSMFRWYNDAQKCYVYLMDVSTSQGKQDQRHWEPAFRDSEWFTRGWTLQELIAPSLVEFFSNEGTLLGNKSSLERQLNEITGIPVGALRGDHLAGFSVPERIRWADNRETKYQEDKAYSLLGIFGVYISLIYGEGRENAFIRLHEAIEKSLKGEHRFRSVELSSN
jgi:hypothetical protein